MNKELSTDHQDILDEWSVNGWNGVQAVLKYRPHLNNGTASAVMKQILKSDKNKAYIQEVRDNLKAQAQIENELILKELITFAYSDATTYLGLTLDEIKELPPDIRRCIDTIEESTKTYTNREKQVITETKIKVKLVDKIKAIEMINKHIGFYAADNNQKTPMIDLTKATPDQLNAVLQLVESQKQLKP